MEMEGGHVKHLNIASKSFIMLTYKNVYIIRLSFRPMFIKVFCYLVLCVYYLSNVKWFSLTLCVISF